MFFEAHTEGRIGYKQLTDTDMGRSIGHTTHIGLFDDILTFLPNNYDGSAMFIYDNKAEILDVFFDRIERENGTFDAPKIRKGGKNAVSVVTVIQDIVNNDRRSDLRWYLIWFGLRSEEAIFFLFNNESEHFTNVSRYINLSHHNVKSRIKHDERGFAPLISYLQDIVNQSSTEILEELEVASQIGSTKKLRQFDVEKANEQFKETGRRGEELIAGYLDRLKYQGSIAHYEWYNKGGIESGLPYDFTMQNNNQSIVHIDVKSTLYKFAQPMIFSNQEIDFVHSSLATYYQIFRVYDISEEVKHLRICENSKDYVPSIHNCISEFKNTLNRNNADVQSIKLAVNPEIRELRFLEEINL